MKQDYTLYIYRADRRCRTGERLYSTTVWRDRDDNGMRREVAELFDLYPPDRGWRFDWVPTMKCKNPRVDKGFEVCYTIG